MFRAPLVILMSVLVFSACGSGTDNPASTPAGTLIPTVNATISPTSTAVIALGNVFYVDGNLGADSSPGTKALPWETIHKAVDMVRGGDIVIVQAGNYEERVIIDRSGVAGAPIEFQAQGNVVIQGFTVQADFVTIRGFEITNTPDDSRDGYGIWVQGSNCLIENNYIHYATWGGILLFTQPGLETQTSHCVVRNNRLYRNSRLGIDVRGRDHLIENNEIWGTIQHHPGMADRPISVDADGIRFFGSGHIFRGNYIHDISMDDPENINPHIDAFQTWDEDAVKAGNNCIFEKNRIVLLSTGTAGLQLEGGTHDLIIRNNIVHTFAGIRSYRNEKSPYTNPSNLFVLNNLFIGGFTYTQWPAGITIQDTTKVVVKNNIFLDQPDRAIDVSGSSELDVNYNIAYNSDGSAPASPIGTSILDNLWGVNPLFVNMTDYHLSADSPAIDAGYPVSVTDDFDGVPRPQGQGYDVGVYEFLEP